MGTRRCDKEVWTAFGESGQILPLQSSPPEWSPGTRTLSEDFQQDQRIFKNKKIKIK